MSSFFSSVTGSVALGVFFLNTVWWCTLLFLFTGLKYCVPLKSWRGWCSSCMVWIAEAWISCNNFEMASLYEIQWNIDGLDGLKPNQSYLVCANHQSWVDIVVLQKIFNRHIPFLRFFLKDELKYVPLLGQAWRALDFPFMKRHSKAFLEKHPEMRGQDLETTRRACEKFRGTPISVLNFLEGTRFTKKKHAKSESPFKNLLPPKIGGVAFVLHAMGSQFTSLIDVTLFYPEGSPTIWDLFTGRLRKVYARIEEVQIPKSLLSGNYLENEAFRAQMQSWLRDLWEKKDNTIERLKGETAHR